MRQAIGSNTPRSVNKVSIQHSLDGHSFSVSGLERVLPGNDAVAVEVLTPQTLLVPAELFDAEAAADLLAAAGMACTGEQRAVWSAPVRIAPETTVVAVMAAETDAVRKVYDRLGYRASFTTPLLNKSAAADTVFLHRAAGILYIKVFARTLCMAEAIPAATEADMLYFVDRLSRVFPLKNMRLHLSGVNTTRASKLIGKRFKKVVCES